MQIILKTPEEIAIMREAGRIIARTHQAMRDAVRPGVSTAELDRIAAECLRDHGAEPAFLNYAPHGKRPFPATITASINSELVHGIPREDRLLQEGDIISLDVGCFYRGFVGDAAFTMGVGAIRPAVQRLLDVTDQALQVGIAASRAGRSLSDVSRAIQKYVEGQGYGLARHYTGHGLGRKMHEPPSVPNWWPRKQKQGLWQDCELLPGMTYALEPMVIAGREDLYELDDAWTVVTRDGSLCAHTEHSIAITEDTALILTEL